MTRSREDNYWHLWDRLRISNHLVEETRSIRSAIGTDTDPIPESIVTEDIGGQIQENATSQETEGIDTIGATPMIDPIQGRDKNHEEGAMKGGDLLHGMGTEKTGTATTDCTRVDQGAHVVATARRKITGDVATILLSHTGVVRGIILTMENGAMVVTIAEHLVIQVAQTTAQTTVAVEAQMVRRLHQMLPRLRSVRGNWRQCKKQPQT